VQKYLFKDHWQDFWETLALCMPIYRQSANTLRAREYLGSEQRPFDGYHPIPSSERMPPGIPHEREYENHMNGWNTVGQNTLNRVRKHDKTFCEANGNRHQVRIRHPVHLS
jgi:hypothetical protein